MRDWRRRSARPTGGISSCGRCPAVTACRHSRPPGAQLGDWLPALRLHRWCSSHRVGLAPPACLRQLRRRGLRPPGAGAIWRRLQRELGRNLRLQVMQSSGGLIAQLLCAKDTILFLRPAGGLVAAVNWAGGSTPIVGFDMGAASPCVPLPRRRAGNGNGTWRCVCRGSGLERPGGDGDRRSLACGGTTAIHPWRPGVARGSTSMASDCKWAGSAGPIQARLATGAGRHHHRRNLLLGRLPPAAFPAVFAREIRGPNPELVRPACVEGSGRAGLPWRRDGEQCLKPWAEGALAIANDDGRSDQAISIPARP